MDQQPSAAQHDAPAPSSTPLAMHLQDLARAKTFFRTQVRLDIRAFARGSVRRLISGTPEQSA